MSKKEDRAAKILSGMVEMADKAVKFKEKPKKVSKESRALDKTLMSSLRSRLERAESDQERDRILKKMDFISQNP